MLGKPTTDAEEQRIAARDRAREIVQKIIEAERLGGGFRTYHENAVTQIEDIIVENAKLKERVKAFDDYQKTLVAR
jgi:hypothetical protein